MSLTLINNNHFSSRLQAIVIFNYFFFYSCDFDFKGTTCNESVIPLPTSISEGFEHSEILGASPLLRIQGASVGYTCDVLASGKALVFDKPGPRLMMTKELNTVNTRYQSQQLILLFPLIVSDTVFHRHNQIVHSLTTVNHRQPN